MISRTFHIDPQMEGQMQKQNRLTNTRLPLQQPQKHQHQHQHHQSVQSHPQMINNHPQSITIDNDHHQFAQSSANHQNGINYITDHHPIICQSISAAQPSQLRHQPAASSLHSHSLVSSMNNTRVPSSSSSSLIGTSATSNTVFDPRLGRLYSTAPPPPPPNGTNEFIHNGFVSIPNLPNTILINNFPQQLQTETPQHLFQQQHSLQSTGTRQAPFQHQISSNLQIQHTSSSSNHEQQHPHPQQHQHQQQQQNHQSHSIQQQQQQFFSQPQSQTMQMHLSPPTTSPFYVSSDSFGQTDQVQNSKMSAAYLPSILTNALATNLNDMQTQQQQQQQQHRQQLPLATSTGNPPTTSTNSPVVLDRINICINNHYSDNGLLSGGGGGSLTTNGTQSVMMPEDTPPLPSPIIPPIQHSGAIDPALLIDSFSNNSENNSNTCPSTPVPPVISEPDSTTTSNTPPTTPENPNATVTVSIIQSPSTSSSASEPLKMIEGQSCNKIAEIAELLVEEPKTSSLVTESTTMMICNAGKIATATPTATAPPIETVITPEISYSIGEDVFVRKEDDRLYLGTIIDSRYQKYRVRFDDKSEVWCSSRDMRKFGSFGDSSKNSGDISNDDKDIGTLCVSCKQRDHNGMEICERCGRGYHQKCTKETTPGSNNWLCKRCNKPMKLDPSDIEQQHDRKVSTAAAVVNQLPYDIKSLTWDAKHRVNQEQIYCYCGKSGQFDHNMLQCCKCLNWFHTACVENFSEPMLRGDGHFVFCCSICSTDGKEFLRRLEIQDVDFIHLILYNLSAQRKHQQHKYHHLTRDICPFILAQRNNILLPKEWHDLSEDGLKDKISTTLKKNSDRFVCGREVKRDCYFYGLRHNGPPMPPKINVQPEDVLSDVFLTKHLKLKLSMQNAKTEERKNSSSSSSYSDKKTNNVSASASKIDVYEFHSDKEGEDIDEEDGKFTSDDDIPIKHILEKEKRNTTTHTKDHQEKDMKLKLLKTATEENENENENEKDEEEDCQESDLKDLKKPSTDDNLVKINEKRSNHKRKAFTLSKPYKETAAAAASKRYHSVWNCESSSDDNSSSSRGTSLDLIIPPPKNFLGLNNPFRNVTPKKNSDLKKSQLQLQYSRCNVSGGPAIKNSIVNTSCLDFSSKLAALKSAGIFPNLNTSSLAKAAGQPRMVRTIKRRLSAKDIMIGPNQEVRRRRTRRLSSNIEVISTTTINPLPSNIFPLNAKELFSTTTNTNAPPIRKQNLLNPFTSPASSSSSPQTSSNSSTSSSVVLFKEQFQSHTNKVDNNNEQVTSSSSTVKLPTHGRRLRTRIQKSVPHTSRRNSISGASTPSSSSTSACTAVTTYPDVSATFNDLQQSVNKYFGAGNRITGGEKFSVYAKRQLPNGQVQYLIEWGNENNNTGGGSTGVDSTTNVDNECGGAQETLESPNID